MGIPGSVVQPVSQLEHDVFEATLHTDPREICLRGVQLPPARSRGRQRVPFDRRTLRKLRAVGGGDEG